MLSIIGSREEETDKDNNAVDNSASSVDGEEMAVGIGAVGTAAGIAGVAIDLVKGLWS